MMIAMRKIILDAEETIIHVVARQRRCDAKRAVVRTSESKSDSERKR